MMVEYGSIRSPGMVFSVFVVFMSTLLISSSLLQSPLEPEPRVAPSVETPPDAQAGAGGEATRYPEPSPGGASSRIEPGTLDWKYDTPEGEEISTPALADLDGDGTLEVVFASAGDAVYALSPAGSKIWRNTENNINTMGHGGSMSYQPPPFFSSVMTADTIGDSDPELFVGVKDGFVCFNPNGSTEWKKGLTDGDYYATPTVTDLEGEYTGDKSELEVVAPSDSSNYRGYMEAFHPAGEGIFRFEVATGGEGPQLTVSAASADMDGSFEDVLQDPPKPGEETWHELEVGYHNSGMMVYGYSQHAGGEPQYDALSPYNLAGHHTFSSAAVGNFSMNNNNAPEECEIIVGSCEGYQTTWENWGGTVYCYDQDGYPLWSFATGSPGAAVQSSAAVCDVQMVEYLGLGELPHNEVFIGCDSGTLYCLNADYGNEIWSYTTGGRMMSSPAICNIGSDDELEVVVGSDDGYVYCFDGDPSDNVDEGISDSGGSSGAYDILWKYDTQGGAIGISSPVVADIDDDGILEVVIGNEAGSVFCIEAGECQQGQVDWPVFRGNVNQTGFYRPSGRAGVALSPDIPDTPEPWVKEVEPGEVVEYSLTVKNTGLGAMSVDTITVDVSPSGHFGSGWSASIGEGLDTDAHGVRYAKLEPGEGKGFVVRVSVPDEAPVGDVAIFTVNATSTIDPGARDSIQLVAKLNYSFGIGLEFTEPALMTDEPENPNNGEKWALITPGEEYTAVIRLSNLGHLNDTFELSLSGVPPYWDVSFSPTGDHEYETTLPSGSWDEGDSPEDIYISIVPPALEYPGSLAALTVTATSTKSMTLLTPGDDSDHVSSSDVCHLEVAEIRSLALVVDEPEKCVDPGGEVTFLANVTNRGNEPQMLDITLNGFEDGWQDGPWEVRHPSQVFVQPGDTKSFELELGAPHDLWVGSEQHLILGCADPGGAGLLNCTGLTVIVNRLCRVNATMEPELVTAKPGEETSQLMTLVNEGNDDDEVTLSIVDENPGWGANLTNDGWGIHGKRVTVPVDYRDSMDVSLVMQVPPGTAPGRYHTTVDMTGEEMDTISLQAVTVVGQEYDVSVRLVVDGVVQSHGVVSGNAGPGTSYIQDVLVQNLGTGTDHVTLSMNSLREGWLCSIVSITDGSDVDTVDGSFRPETTIMIPSEGIPFAFYPDMEDGPVSRVVLGLNKGAAAVVQVRVDIPREAENMDVGGATIGVSSSSADNDGTNDEVRLELTVLMSDLAFTMNPGVLHTASLGQSLYIDATVINFGMFYAGDILVALTVSGGTVNETVVSVLEPGYSTDLRFEMVVGVDVDDVWLVIDPLDAVVESDESNNRYKVSITTVTPKEGEAGDDDKAGGFGMTALIAIIVILVAAVAAALMVMRSRAARARKEEEEEKAAAPLLYAEMEGVGPKGPAALQPVPKPVIDVTGPQPLAGPLATAPPRPVVVPKIPVPALVGNPDIPALPPVRMRPAAPAETGEG